MDENEILETIELARETGKIKKGINETTKSIERGASQLVIYAEDVDPKEIVMHLEPLCEEKNMKCITVSKKDSLGRAAGIQVPTSAVAIEDPGEASEKIKEISTGKKEGTKKPEESEKSKESE